ncbi:MAG: preprotein translocase subunit SecA [Planctomycetaceae bacterium]
MIGLFNRNSGSDASLAAQSYEMASGLGGDNLASLFAELRIVHLSRTRTPSGSTSAFSIAIAAEAIYRQTGMRPYAVQHHAAMVMARGGVAEMATGEGKTVAVAMAGAALAATGKSVHISTANEYLAERDQSQMRGAFERLGLHCGLVNNRTAAGEKRAAYRGDIVYATVDTFAFDYLGDVLLRREWAERPLGSSRAGNPRAKLVCHRRHAMVIDEIDLLLIAEAITPLVLSSAPRDSVTICESVYAEALGVAERLERDLDWVVQGESRRCTLTARGIAKSLQRIPESRLARPWTEYVQRAIDATWLLRRDVDYVVQRDQIVLVDQATGRLAQGRQWQDGLYQAVQHREGLRIDNESVSAAQITRWRFLRLYDQLSGCSGTAWDCREELQRVYGLSTTRIPPRVKSMRITMPPCFAANRQQKWQQIAEEVRAVHSTGRPVLIGTCNVSQSLELATELARQGLEIRVLNGIQDEDEAKVIAAAGEHGAITVATDMAGRGTDILVSEAVAKLGGLHVVVTEPRHSARLDRQLIGRCARQGQPGSSRTFVAADDAVLLQHGRGLSRFLSRHLKPSTATRPLWAAVVSAAKRSESEMASARARLARREVGRDHFLSLADASPEPNR